MAVSNQTQAVLLLTAYLAKPTKGDPRPLSPAEWGRFAQWLRDHAIPPEALLSNDPARLLAGWTDRTVTLDRIEHLLGRGGALGLVLEKWQRAGLWVLARSDADYPGRLKKRLRADAPPVLFGCGNRNLLNQGGVAVVGSRKAADEELAFATKLGNDAALQGLSIVSGGARGVDEAAMLGALDREGTVVGVLADGLLRAATSARYRKHLMANNLVLVSPFNPEAGFDVGHAMARNRYIYCLSDAAIVVSSGRDKGGTWNGAIENLKEGWVPLWVKLHPDVASGNAELVRRGARWLPDDGLELAALFAGMDGPRLSERTARGFGDALSIVPQARPDPTSVAAPYAAQETTAPALPKALPMQATSESSPAPREEALLSFYDLFLRRLQDLTSKIPLTAEQLLSHLDVTKPQLNIWLKRAVEEGYAKKLNKPVRFRWQGVQPTQGSMFDER